MLEYSDRINLHLQSLANRIELTYSQFDKMIDTLDNPNLSQRVLLHLLLISSKTCSTNISQPAA